MKREELTFFRPDEIERRSMALIERELKENYKIKLSPEIAPIVKRVIHTTADFSYAENLAFSARAVELAKEALRSGTPVVTDTNMALSGINKKRLAQYGGEVHCFMADEDVVKEATERGITRASVSMEKSRSLGDGLIYVIGNAPTALVTLYDLISAGNIHPRLIIGVPVGFVNVIEAKELILTLPTPHIIARGRKGGSNVAAAIVNALLYDM